MTNMPYTDFTTPHAIVKHGSLTPKEKMELLSDWKLDVNRLMESTQENMVAYGHEDAKNCAMLRDINIAMRSLHDRTISTAHFAR